MPDWREDPSDNELLRRQTDLLQMALIQQLRIYDVLLALLGASNKEAFNTIIDKHEKFEYIGPLPYQETEGDS